MLAGLNTRKIEKIHPMDANTLSPEMEDYLETIAELFRAGGEARVTDIAERLSVRKASVTQALRSLADKGLVHYQPYVSPRLTAAGTKVARRVQHRHDVLKRFLAQVLHVAPERAEINACRLEHAVDSEVLEHLTQFMDFVQRCPRGGKEWVRSYEHFCDADNDSENCRQCMTTIIDGFQQQHKPQSGAKEQVMTLAELKVGKTARIVRVGSVGAMRRRIVDMGVVTGTEVTMVKVAPLGDPLEVKVKGYNLVLRKVEAEAITIEVATADLPTP